MGYFEFLSAVLIKLYGTERAGEARYSSAQCIRYKAWPLVLRIGCGKCLTWVALLEAGRRRLKGAA